MSSNEQSIQQSEYVRTPRVAALAGSFVLAVESADANSPVSIDTVGDDQESFTSCLAAELERADIVYEHHRQLFYPDGSTTDINKLSLPEILDNTRAALGIIGPTVDRKRGLLLGLSILQLGEMALAVAERPELLIASSQMDSDKMQPVMLRHNVRNLPPDRLEATAAHSLRYHEVTESLFKDVLAPRLQGDIDQVPFYKFSYTGFPLDMYYQFWQNYQSVIALQPDLQVRLDALLDQFPSKTVIFDGHTASGRPSPEQARQNHVHKLRAFEASLQLPAPKGFEASGNFSDAFNVIFLALGSAAERGHNDATAFRIAARHISALGRLTERSTVDLPVPTSYLLDDSPHDPGFTIEHPTDKMDMTEKLRRKSQKGGICPARNPVAIPLGGRTYRGAEAISEALYEHTGFRPSFLHHIANKVYVDPAAFVLGISLLGVIENSQRNQ